MFNWVLNTLLLLDGYYLHGLSSLSVHIAVPECFRNVAPIAWNVSKYGVFSGPYFPVFGPEKTPYLDTFHAVSKITMYFKIVFQNCFLFFDPKWSLWVLRFPYWFSNRTFHEMATCCINSFYNLRNNAVLCKINTFIKKQFLMV